MVKITLNGTEIQPEEVELRDEAKKMIAELLNH